jgi:hypothetical protein
LEKSIVELAVAAEYKKFPLLRIEYPQSLEFMIESTEAAQGAPCGIKQLLYKAHRGKGKGKEEKNQEN